MKLKCATLFGVHTEHKMKQEQLDFAYRTSEDKLAGTA